MDKYTTVSKNPYDGAIETNTDRYARSSGRYVGTTKSSEGIDPYGNQYSESTKYNSRGKATDSSRTEIPKELVGSNKIASIGGEDKKEKRANTIIQQTQDPVESAYGFDSGSSLASPSMDSSYSAAGNISQLDKFDSSKNSSSSLLSDTFNSSSNSSSMLGNNSSTLGGSSSILNKSNSLLSSPTSYLADTEKREFGGPVEKGKTYLTGENKPETYVSNKSGLAVPVGRSGPEFIVPEEDGYVLPYRPIPVTEQDSETRNYEQSLLSDALSYGSSGQTTQIAAPTEYTQEQIANSKPVISVNFDNDTITTVENGKKKVVSLSKTYDHAGIEPKGLPREQAIGLAVSIARDYTSQKPSAGGKGATNTDRVAAPVTSNRPEVIVPNKDGKIVATRPTEDYYMNNKSFDYPTDTQRGMKLNKYGYNEDGVQVFGQKAGIYPYFEPDSPGSASTSKRGVGVVGNSGVSIPNNYTQVGEKFNDLTAEEQKSLSAAIAADSKDNKKQIALPTADQYTWDTAYNKPQPTGVSEDEIQQRQSKLRSQFPDRAVAHRVEMITGGKIIPQYFEAENFKGNKNFDSQERGVNLLDEGALRQRLSNSNNYKEYLLNPDYNPEAGESRLYSIPRRNAMMDIAALRDLEDRRMKQEEVIAGVGLIGAQSNQLQSEVARNALINNYYKNVIAKGEQEKQVATPQPAPVAPAVPAPIVPPTPRVDAYSEYNDVWIPQPKKKKINKLWDSRSRAIAYPGM